MRNFLKEIPAPKNSAEERVYDFAVDVARRLIANPTAVRNGFRVGSSVKQRPKSENPFQTLAPATEGKPVYDSPDTEMAFCVSAVAGLLSKDC